MSPGGLLTYREARDYLAISRTRLWQLISQGHFRVFRHGHTYRLYVDDVVAYRDAHTQQECA